MRVKWEKLSPKQLKLITWWMDENRLKKHSGIIAEGSIRSGKTLVMSLSFLFWSYSNYNRCEFAICGKTIGSLRRNVITSLKEVLINRGFRVIDRKSDNQLIISKDGIVNTYYLFGGRDERSQDLIQGVTLAGVLFDEVALMPRSFVEQAMGRCSVEGSKYWFNCNPEGPSHWFYQEHILKADELGYLVLHFELDDNPSLSEEIKNRYKSMFTGIFYKRFILGEWAFADGVIYDCFNPDIHCYSNADRDKVLPIRIRENDPNGGYIYVASDYGVVNPMVYLECYKIRLPESRIPYFYIDNEYYYDSKKQLVQKTDAEYVEDLIKMINGRYYNSLIIDPSASSLIAACRMAGVNTIKANNDVDLGIRLVYSLFSLGHIMINKDNCPNLVKELGGYSWDSKKADNGKEVPLKVNDHACDALRYFIATTTKNYEVIGD